MIKINDFIGTVVGVKAYPNYLFLNVVDLDECKDEFSIKVSKDLYKRAKIKKFRYIQCDIKLTGRYPHNNMEIERVRVASNKNALAKSEYENE